MCKCHAPIECARVMCKIPLHGPFRDSLHSTCYTLKERVVVVIITVVAFKTPSCM